MHPSTVRAGASLRRLTPAQWTLALLLIVGIALRVLAAAAEWPIYPKLADSTAYAHYAENGVLGNPQHPAGYSIFLAFLGTVTREVAVPIVLHHLFGVATALLLYASVLRLSGSRWFALLPAAVVLLSSDQILLEQSIMSEPLCTVLLAAALYCATRALVGGDRWWAWPLAAGALTAASGTVRTQVLFLVPVLLLVLLLRRPRPLSWSAPLGAFAGLALVLVPFAVANRIDHGRLEIAPASGWHLYGRVGPFADCGQFTPPKGTEQLCTLAPSPRTIGNDWFIFYPDSPAIRTFGGLGEQDDKLLAWSRAVIIGQPRTYVTAVLKEMAAYFVPSVRRPLPYTGPDLGPELDWTRPDPGAPRNIEVMERFFDDFDVTENGDVTRFLGGYQEWGRFGSKLLTACTLLIALGLALGDRRHRLGIALFGLGGLSMLLLPLFGGWFAGRYLVPNSGPIAAGAAIALHALWLYGRARWAAREGAGRERPRAPAAATQ